MHAGRRGGIGPTSTVVGLVPLRVDPSAASTRLCSIGLGLMLVFASATCAAKDDAVHCPATPGNGVVYPGEPETPLGYGEGSLYTILWPDGTVVFDKDGPGVIADDGSLSMKWPWYRGDGATGKLQISGTRLDSASPPLQADVPDGYGLTGFQVSVIKFAAPGCWQVTGRVDQASLSFVARVIRKQ